MTFLEGSAQVVHSSKLPETVSRKQAIAMLRDHEFFLHCDPHMSKFSRLEGQTPTALPEAMGGKAQGGEECYTVTDVVHAMPAGLWDSNVVSTYEFTDIEGGVFVRIRSPLSIVLDTVWEIRGEDGQLEMVEDASICCSRLLVGVVKSQCENGWEKIHSKMIARLTDEVAQSA